uniref:Defective in cullin neddylation protein n=1 Tax=Rhabditophanes sp. KR3021 TaxID=114890 RepID=A0AC35UI45_9BILA
MGGYNQTISGGTKADKQYEEGAKQFYATFKSLSDDTPDKLGPNSIQRFLEAFNYDETDRRVLIFAWLANAEIQCEFSMAELEMVFKKLKVANMQDLQRNLDRINNQLDRPEDKVNFDSLYEFTFLFAKTTPNQKGLNAEVAIAYWKILYKTNNASYGIVQKWFEFLGDVNQKYISRDTWNLFNSFTRVINADFSNHSSNDSWPVLIDEFVDYVRSKQR